MKVSFHQVVYSIMLPLNYALFVLFIID